MSTSGSPVSTPASRLLAAKRGQVRDNSVCRKSDTDPLTLSRLENGRGSDAELTVTMLDDGRFWNLFSSKLAETDDINGSGSQIVA